MKVCLQVIRQDSEMDGLFDEKRIAFHGDGILLQGSQKIGSQALSGHCIRGAEGIRVQ